MKMFMSVSRPVQDLRIEQVNRFAVEKAEDIGHGHLIPFAENFHCCVAPVRQENEVVQPPQRMVGWEWLLVVYVEPRSGDAVLLQGLDQSRFGNDRPSGGVYQDRLSLHPGNLFLSDQTSGLWSQWAVHRDNIRLFEQGFERDSGSSHLTSPFIGQGLSRCQVSGSEGLADLRHFFPDPAETDDAQCFALEEPARYGWPPLRTHFPVDEWDLSQHRKNQRKGQLHCGNSGIGGGEGNRNPTPGGSGEIEMSGRFAGLRDKLEIGSQ